MPKRKLKFELIEKDNIKWIGILLPGCTKFRLVQMKGSVRVEYLMEELSIITQLSH